MSRRNRHQNRAPQVHVSEGALTGTASVTGTVSAANLEAITSTDSLVETVVEVSRETDPYYSEERSFSAYGAKIDADALALYLNRFALERDAVLLQMIPTLPGSYLFIWEMP